MTIKELKEAIKLLPDDMEVILQRDPEGNGYSPCAGLDTSCIYIDDTYHNGAYSKNWTAEDAGMTEEEWEEFKKRDTIAVLWPTD